MRVLWLSETPSKYKTEEFGYNGRGWIESLQTLVEKSPQISGLGVAFPHTTDNAVLVAGKTTYYPIKRVMHNGFFSWVVSNWLNKIEHKEEIQVLGSIINEFKPDIVHIFGTESWLCNAIKLTKSPCIIHIQGILQPISSVYLPYGFSNLSSATLNLKHLLQGNSIWHYKRTLLKKALREQTYMKNAKFFMGRTEWDRQLSGFLSPMSTYYHVDEVLRDPFYKANKWNQNNSDKIILTSTLSNAPYKGLDVVVKTAQLLINQGVSFEWNIIGITEVSSLAILIKKQLNINYKSLNINLMGVKNAEEIIELLTSSSFYIHPSYIDNSPNSICEAQMIGVPCIATNVGGVSSLIANNVNGFLVPSNDHYYLAALISSLKDKSDFLLQISENSRKLSLKRHSEDSIIQDLLETYQKITIKR